jgi:hypothetical protein
MVVEALPTLIHVSVSLFFSGLVVLLWNVNLMIFKVVLSWIGLYTVFYGCITFIPIFLPDSPFYSLLTQLAWPAVAAILVALKALYLVVFLLVSFCALCFSCSGPVRLVGHLSDWFTQVTNITAMTLCKK